MQTEEAIELIKGFPGYVLLKNVLSPEIVQKLLQLINHYHQVSPKPKSDVVPYLNQGHSIIYNLQNKDIDFIKICFDLPQIKSILMGILNDQWYKQIPSDKPNYILRSMLARSGGDSALPLHIDSFIPSLSNYSWSAQVSLILEDQFPENGCTVVVPGSHLTDTYADANSRWAKKATPIPSQVGDALIWDSRLWHQTTPNMSGKTRWALISTYTRWWIKQNYDIPKALPQEFYNQLTQEEKSILGYCSRTPLDEYERIDIKGGYELLG